MAVVAGCKACEKGGCGEVCTAGPLEGLEGGQMAALNPLKTDGRGGGLPRGARGVLGRLPWKGLRGFGGFGGRANGSLECLKNRWPWWLAAKRCKRPAWTVALERLAEGLKRLKGLKRLRAGKRQP